MSFGTPTGSVRIAAVPIAVPPPPPIETTPSMRPSRWSRAATSAAPRAAAAIASPRSSRARRAARSERAGAGNLLAGTVGCEDRLAENADVDHERFAMPAASIARLEDRRTRRPWCRACRRSRRPWASSTNRSHGTLSCRTVPTRKLFLTRQEEGLHATVLADLGTIRSRESVAAIGYVLARHFC